MIPYCGNKSSLLEPWVDHGLSPCFFFTVTTSVVGGIMILFGGGQLYLFHKYATRMEQRLVTHSIWFRLQILIAITLSVEPMIYLALRGTVLDDKQIVGYEVFATVVGAVSWWMACVVAYVECRWMLPTIPTRGHGLVLLVFLAFAFVVENLAFLSLNSSLWWFKDRNYSTNIELGFFCWRYVCTLISFILGLVAPGTMSIQPNVFVQNPDGDQNVLLDSEQGLDNSVSSSSGVNSSQPL